MTDQRFAFYGRVSTEDNQDPAASRAWQLSRATELIAPHGGEIVQEFFDIGVSRSLPWQRRPQAADLLHTIRNLAPSWTAIVIGEPHRAFYSNQFSLTFPLLCHYGIELWVPEVGGRVDPDSEAHDLMMAMFGGLSKAERGRIRTRVRSAMRSMATDGRFLGGRPPYGYRLADAGPHPNPSKAADGKRLHRLDIDPKAAPVVERIFRLYVAGFGYRAIAETLTLDGFPSPSAYDPARNPHRDPSGWSHSAVRGRSSPTPPTAAVATWGKQQKFEELIDPDDVAAGNVTRMRWRRDPNGSRRKPRPIPPS